MNYRNTPVIHTDLILVKFVSCSPIIGCIQTEIVSKNRFFYVFYANLAQILLFHKSSICEASFLPVFLNMQKCMLFTSEYGCLCEKLCLHLMGLYSVLGVPFLRGSNFLIFARGSSSVRIILVKILWESTGRERGLVYFALSHYHDLCTHANCMNSK